MIKFLLSVFIAVVINSPVVFAFAKTDELYIDYHYFLHFTPNPKSAFDYVDHVNKRIDHALKKEESFAAKNLIELLDVYLTHGIPGLVGFDKTRTATDGEMKHVLKSADYYTHILSAYFPKLETYDKSHSITDSKRCFSYRLIHRNLRLNETISDEVGRKNGETFASIVLGKRGITGAEFKNHCKALQNDSHKFYYASCKTELNSGDLQIVTGKVIDLSWIQNVTEKLTSFKKPWKKLTKPDFEIIAKSECGSTPIYDKFYYRDFTKQYTKGDGSCFFHAVSQDNSNDFTYDAFKDKVINETNPERQKKFCDFLKEGIKGNGVPATDFDFNKQYTELAKAYFKNWENLSHEHGPAWQYRPTNNNYEYPSTLYCYLNSVCCCTDANPILMYAPSTTPCQFRFIHQQGGNHYEMLIPKAIEE